MGRPKGSKNKPKIIHTDPPPAPGHNALTDEQMQALFFQNKRSYEAALAVKKKADADLKNVCKRAKSDLGEGAVERIKYALELETEEGEAKLKARITRQIEVARWMGLEVGTQADLFGEDRTPGDERARAEGKRAGMEAKERKAPYDPSTSQHREWMAGYDEGQAANRSLLQDSMKPPAEPDAEQDPFDDALPGKGDDDGEWDAAAPTH